jgi:hypothetical protein
MEASQLKRLKELEEENRKLKQMYADQSLAEREGIEPSEILYFTVVMSF